MNILTAINIASKKLKDKGINTYKLDCEILMSKAIGEKKENILLNLNKEIDKKQIILFDSLINERIKKKPIAYLTGSREFWKYQFYITNDVLIPRPETEIIIEQTLRLTKSKSKLNFLDIGVGSGCIILSILKEKRNF